MGNSVEHILYVFLCIIVVLTYKVDPDNAPHVGGNTWAGGTGGRDTAGLGGKGGPYRLDAGHTVYQISDAEKDAVPEEVSMLLCYVLYVCMYVCSQVVCALLMSLITDQGRQECRFVCMFELV